MSNIEWEKVAKVVKPNSKRIPYQENKHLFTKIAFDVYQYSNDISESLWSLECDDDGKEYLVAQYEDNINDNQSLQANSSWESFSDNSCDNITLYYKNKPIKRLASKNYGFSKSDIHIFKATLIQKLATNHKFVKKLLESLPEEHKDKLISEFPELLTK